jgi:hypothetical protein
MLLLQGFSDSQLTPLRKRNGAVDLPYFPAVKAAFLLEAIWTEEWNEAIF